MKQNCALSFKIRSLDDKSAEYTPVYLNEGGVDNCSQIIQLTGNNTKLILLKKGSDDLCNLNQRR
ncbi:hypothetical protein JWG40_00105 [Leptospira sp. 201903074]|uniref:hypothetical protein n=1 Tax=Leptospira abararensis TaxID=2810036 RepID=UPI00196303CD|nr:hypothetical protein [Leptospira abararensis]MBM9545402.1 hypothetical protein [Leptospira abararensis]